MIESIRSWLFGVIAASFFVSVCQSLIPEGAIRKFAGFTGGLVLLTVMIQPMAQLRWENPTFRAYEGEIAALQENFEKENQENLRTLIAAETAAYISDKAASLGLACTAEVAVELNTAAVPIPVSVTLHGEVSEALLADITENLGIPCTIAKGEP